MHRLLLEVFRLSFQVLDLLVFRQFKLVSVDLIPERFQLTLDHAHMTAIRIEKILLGLCTDPLDQAIDIINLVIDHVKSHNDPLLRDHLC